MPIKRVASRQGSRNDPSSDDSSSRGDGQFIISPRPRRETRKSTHQGEGSSTQADEEAANKAEGRSMAAAREAKASGIIQKVERPLRTDYEYTLRRVGRHHPRRAT
jgi:hypothetical protein